MSQVLRIVKAASSTPCACRRCTPGLPAKIFNALLDKITAPVAPPSDLGAAIKTRAETRPPTIHERQADLAKKLAEGRSEVK
jgi:hypothetical protein